MYRQEIEDKQGTAGVLVAADKVVLDKGQLVEQGRLHELLALKGYFSALYLAQ